MWKPKPYFLWRKLNPNPKSGTKTLPQLLANLAKPLPQLREYARCRNPDTCDLYLLQRHLERRIMSYSSILRNRWLFLNSITRFAWTQSWHIIACWEAPVVYVKLIFLKCKYLDCWCAGRQWPCIVLLDGLSIDCVDAVKHYISITGSSRPIQRYVTVAVTLFVASAVSIYMYLEMAW